MAGKLPMGQKELVRSKVLAMVVEGQLSLKDASIKLKVSYRQARRLLRRYREHGDAGLLHRLAGRKSNNRLDEVFRAKVLEAYQQTYQGFGPTLASEKLGEREGLRINAETLRQLLISEGLWQRKKRARGYHARRLPRERFGELVQ
jgi:transposase